MRRMVGAPVQVFVRRAKEGQRQVIAAAQHGDRLREVQLAAGAIAVNDRQPGDAKDDVRQADGGPDDQPQHDETRRPARAAE